MSSIALAADRVSTTKWTGARMPQCSAAEAYGANEIGADAKYRDKSLLVTGVVARIGKEGGKPVVDFFVLEAPKGEFRAEFSTDAGLGTLKPDQTIAARCRGGNADHRPTLSECVFDRVVPDDPPDKLEVAREAVAGIAKQTYSFWRSNNPKRVCPKSYAELAPYMRAEDVKDPWGQPYRVMCNSSAAAGKRLRVSSNGPDQKPDTADDIKSWE